ncbi:MAG: MBL fold metallo-hydrolase [Actinomycetota bacterium]
MERHRRPIGRDPTELTRILITHAHPDHLGCARQLSGGTTPIDIHSADGDVARSGVAEPPGVVIPFAFVNVRGALIGAFYVFLDFLVLEVDICRRMV